MLNFINLIDIFEWEVNLIRLVMCVYDVNIPLQRVF